MAMPKLFGQVLEKLEMLTTVLQMLQRIETKVDKINARLEAAKPMDTGRPAQTLPRIEPPMQPSQTGGMRTETPKPAVKK